MLLNRLIDSDVSESFHRETRERFVQLASTFSTWLLVNNSSVPPPADWRVSLCTLASVSSYSLLSSRSSVRLSVNLDSVLSVSRNGVYFPRGRRSSAEWRGVTGGGERLGIFVLITLECALLSMRNSRFLLIVFFSSLLRFPCSCSIIFFFVFFIIYY